jgi:hypothetical protein
LKERTQVERVPTKAEPDSTPTTKPRAAPTAKPTTTFPQLEIEYPDIDVGQPRRTPLVSQDNYKSISPPAANTRHQRKGRTITEDFLFHIMDVPTLTQPFTNPNKPHLTSSISNSFATLHQQYLTTRLVTSWSIAIC